MAYVVYFDKYILMKTLRACSRQADTFRPVKISQELKQTNAHKYDLFANVSIPTPELCKIMNLKRYLKTLKIYICPENRKQLWIN